MIDLEAIKTRCDAVGELKRAYPCGWGAEFVDPAVAFNDRRELLDEVEQLQATLNDKRRYIKRLQTDLRDNAEVMEAMAAERDELRTEVEQSTPPGKISTAEALVYSWNWQRYQGELLSEINEMMDTLDIPTERHFHCGLQTYIVTDRVRILVQKYRKLAEQAEE